MSLEPTSTPRFDPDNNIFWDCFGNPIREGCTVIYAENTAAKSSGGAKIYKVEEFVLTEKKVGPRRTDPITGGSLYDTVPWAKFRVRRWYGRSDGTGEWNDRRQQLDTNWWIRVG